MTGKIRILRTGKVSGFISAGNGLSVYFDESAFLADAPHGLTVGQRVNFDLTTSHPPRAANLCVEKQLNSAETEKKRPDTINLRYVGFDQKGSIRSYKFEGLLFGEETRSFVVNTDLSLFAKHHVGIQDGPALCLHLLTAERDAAGTGGQPQPLRSLTDQDMVTHLASRAASGSRLRHRRTLALPLTAARHA